MKRLLRTLPRVAFARRSYYEPFTIERHEIPSAIAEITELPIDIMTRQQRTATLRQCEWVHDTGLKRSYCPVCDNDRERGHRADCELKELIAEMETMDA